MKRTPPEMESVESVLQAAMKEFYQEAKRYDAALTRHIKALMAAKAKLVATPTTHQAAGERLTYFDNGISGAQRHKGMLKPLLDELEKSKKKGSKK